jgi:hypothetical protein
MASADAAHDLKALVQSRHPLITIDTVEEERVDNLLGGVAADLHMPLFTWTVTHGLRRVGGDGPIYGTAHPETLVRHLATLTVRAIFHLKDLAAHLGDPTVARGLRDTAQTFLRSGATAVMSGESIRLPGELARESVPFVLHLPDRDELQQVVHQILHTLKRQHPLSVTLGADGMDALLNALSGLTLNQARQAVSWAVLDDNAKPRFDLSALGRQ